MCKWTEYWKRYSVFFDIHTEPGSHKKTKERYACIKTTLSFYGYLGIRHNGKMRSILEMPGGENRAHCGEKCKLSYGKPPFSYLFTRHITLNMLKIAI